MDAHPSPNLIIDVPSDVYDFIQNVKAEDPDTATSLDKMVKLARKEGLKEVAKWIKNNPIAYGVGYWNGFASIPPEINETPDPEPTTPTKRKRKRRRMPPTKENK